MTAITQHSRILLKRSDTHGVTPTVPVSDDHTDGTWGPTDIYVGELFMNTSDELLWIRGASGIVQLGQQGPIGHQGEMGFQGLQGFQGLSGPIGFQGFQGYYGPTGQIGLQGPQGPQGGGLKWTFVAGRSAAIISDQDLRTSDSIPTNMSPHIVPVNCRLVAMSASSEPGSTSSWNGVVYKNNISDSILGIASSDSSYDLFSSTFSAGDKVRIRFEGADSYVNSPTVTIFFEQI